MAAFPLISISGPPWERGLVYGRLAGDHIQSSIRTYAGKLLDLNISKGDLKDLAHKFVPLIDRFDETYSVEMRAIAEGAGVTFEEILLINARTELLALADGRIAELDMAAEGCTGAVILPGRSVNGRLLHGQNWDWLPECANSSIILKVQPERGPSFLTFTEAGGLARNGFNSAGIAVTANYLECDRDFSQTGLPLALLRRKILEQEHLAQALRIVSVTPKSASNNLMISHTDGFAISIECAPDEAFNVMPSEGLLVHANHWQNLAARTKLRTQAAENWADSFYRDWRVQQLLSSREKLTLEDLKRAFGDTFGAPFGVCRSPCRLGDAKELETVASIVMDPAAGLMEVACRPHAGGGYTSYNLGGEEKEQRLAVAQG